MARRLHTRSVGLQASVIGIGALVLRWLSQSDSCDAFLGLPALNACSGRASSIPRRACSVVVKPQASPSAPLAIKPDARRKSFPDAVDVEATINGVTIHLLEAGVEWQERLIEEAVEAEEESLAADPYGMAIWPSAQVVAQAATAHVKPLIEASVRHVRRFRKRVAIPSENPPRVLELGAGCGLVSLTVAAMGVEVLATDFRELPLKMLAESARLQGFDKRVSTQVFDVTNMSEPLPPADLVIAADLLYDRDTAAAMARRVVEARERGSSVLLGDVGRPNAKVFLEELQRLRPEEPTGFWFYGTALQKKREGIYSGGPAMQNEKKFRVDLLELPLGPARMTIHPAHPSVLIRPRGHDHVL